MRLGEDSSIGTEEIRRKTMGRALDMEKDIDKLRVDVRKLQEILNDLVQGAIINDKKKIKKTNDKSDSGSSGKSSKGNSDTTSKD